MPQTRHKDDCILAETALDEEQQVQRLHSARATLSGVPPLSHGMFHVHNAIALCLDGATP
jgi:hypothetical protein